MVKGFSKAIVAGNLTRDPEFRTTGSGQTVTSFSIAVNRAYRDSSGQLVEQVSYINCTAWGKTAETISKYTRRGSGILVSGRLQQRSWEDKETGAKRSTTEVVVEEFTFLSGGRGENEGGVSSYESIPAPASTKRGGAKKASANEDVLPSDSEMSGEPDINLDDVPF